METNQNQPVSHDNQEPNQPQSKQSAEPNSLGCLLTIVITIGVSFLASTICGPGVSTSMSNGTGDIVDLAGKAGSIAGMTLGMATLVGPITYSVMRKLLPKKPASPNLTKSAGTDGQLPGSLVAANAPTGGTAPVVIAPGPHPAAKKPKTRVILLLALIVFGMAIVIWVQTAAKGVDLRSLFASGAAEVPLGHGGGNPGRAPEDCQLWSEISATDVGRTACAYGVVNTAYLGSGITYIRFSDEKDSFRLINMNGKDFSEVIGQCVVAEGIVKTYGQMLYIEVKDQVELCK